MSKGSRSRVSNQEKYRQNYEAIFGPKPEKPSSTNEEPGSGERLAAPFEITMEATDEVAEEDEEFFRRYNVIPAGDPRLAPQVILRPIED